MIPRVAAAALLALALAACKNAGVIGYPAPITCSETAPCPDGQRCNADAECEACEGDDCEQADAHVPGTSDCDPPDAQCAECQADADCGGELPFCVDHACRMCKEDNDCASGQCEDGLCVTEEGDEAEPESDSSGSGSEDDL